METQTARPTMLDLLRLVVPGPRTGSHSYIDLRHDAVALGSGVGAGWRPTGRRPAPAAPFVPQRVGAAAEVLGQSLAVVLCENAGEPRWMNWCRYVGLRSMASEAVRRFVRLLATILSSRRRTGSSSASLFTVRRPIEWEITLSVPRASLLLYPRYHPVQSRLKPTGDERQNRDSVSR